MGPLESGMREARPTPLWGARAIAPLFAVQGRTLASPRAGRKRRAARRSG